MEKLKLNASVRMKEEGAKELRESKLVPCVVYWPDQEPISIKVDASDILRAYRKAWESTIMSLEIWKKKLEVIFHAIQKEPVRGNFQHVDFYAITKWKKLHTKIHLNFIWVAAAKKEWAIIEELNKEIEVQCLPTDLVDHFDVDLSLLKNVWDSIKVSDLVIDSNKYEILTNLDDIVVVAWEPAKIQEENVVVEETEPEVEWTKTEKK